MSNMMLFLRTESQQGIYVLLWSNRENTRHKYRWKHSFYYISLHPFAAGTGGSCLQVLHSLSLLSDESLQQRVWTEEIVDWQKRGKKRADAVCFSKKVLPFLPNDSLQLHSPLHKHHKLWCNVAGNEVCSFEKMGNRESEQLQFKAFFSICQGPSRMSHMHTGTPLL